jgi:uncharacterized membrane protein YedE/YeeE
MTLILNDLQPLHWAAAGAAIAAVTLILMFATNRRLGFSSGFEDLCGLVLRQPYFTRGSLRAAREWRLPLVAGLIIGGFASAVLGGGWRLTWEAGRFDAVIGGGQAAKLVWMFVGGLLIGFGTRLANGCTSGHGIFGISNFERSSLLATLTFLGAGIITTHIIYRLLFP